MNFSPQAFRYRFSPDTLAPVVGIVLIFASPVLAALAFQSTLVRVDKSTHHIAYGLVAIAAIAGFFGLGKSGPGPDEWKAKALFGIFAYLMFIGLIMLKH